eukprot:scaffold6759_cov107-Isochrysis_galbana.AAC.2
MEYGGHGGSHAPSTDPPTPLGAASSRSALCSATVRRTLLQVRAQRSQEAKAKGGDGSFWQVLDDRKSRFVHQG